jgi:hypothetical protein
MLGQECVNVLIGVIDTCAEHCMDRVAMFECYVDITGVSQVHVVCNSMFVYCRLQS